MFYKEAARLKRGDHITSKWGAANPVEVDRVQVSKRTVYIIGVNGDVYRHLNVKACQQAAAKR